MADIEKAHAAINAMLRVEEGLRLKPYLCDAKVPTIGYGSTTYLDGRKVKLSDPPITKVQAERMLEVEVTRYTAEVLEMVHGECTTNQLVGLVVCAFNIGLGNETKGMRSSGMIRLHNQGKFTEAAAFFQRWGNYRPVKDGPLVPHPSLHARRLREAAVYSTPDPDAENVQVGVPQAVEAPPTLAKSPTAVTSVGVGGAGAVAVLADWVQTASEVGTTMAPAKASLEGIAGTLDAGKGLLASVVPFPPKYWLPMLCIAGGAYIWYRRRKQRLEGVA